MWGSCFSWDTSTFLTHTSPWLRHHHHYHHCHHHHLRELFYDRNPGDARVKVGSERQAASRRAGPTEAAAEIGYTTIWNLSAGTLQIWPCYMGIYSDKALPELFYDLFLARTGSRREGAGGGWDGSRTRPETADLFWKKNMKYVLL